MLEKLEKRVEKLETDIGALRVDVASIKAGMQTMATKEDLQREMGGMHKEIHAQTWRIVGAIFLITGVALTSAKLLF